MIPRVILQVKENWTYHGLIVIWAVHFVGSDMLQITHWNISLIGQEIEHSYSDEPQFFLSELYGQTLTIHFSLDKIDTIRLYGVGSTWLLSWMIYG